MPANPYTVSSLIASLKRRGQLPSSSQQLSAEDFLAFATEELQTYLTSLLLSVQEEYLIAVKDVSTSAAFVPMPSRAIGGKLRDARVWNGTGYSPLLRLEPERVTDASPGTPVGYTLSGNGLTLQPAPSGATTLRLTYFRRPNRLVEETAVGLITAINTGTGVITVEELPDTFQGAAVVDFIQAQPGFDALGEDVSGTGDTSAGTLAVAPSAVPATLAVGDYVCLAGESPVPQVPVELHPLLAQRVVVKALEAIGDPKAAVAKTMCDEARKAALTLLTPRVESAVRPIVNYWAPGWRR